MIKRICALLLATLLLSSFGFFMDDQPSSRAHFMAAGIANVFIGTGEGTNGSPASDPANWVLGHVPLPGEDVLFDARSGECDWDIDVDVADLTLQDNFTKLISLPNSHMHVLGNLSMLGAGGISIVGSLNDNFVVDGWTRISGNITASDEYPVFSGTSGSSHGWYFNGAFTVIWPTVGILNIQGRVTFNDTFSFNGTTQPRVDVESKWHKVLHHPAYRIQVDFGGGSNVQFMKNAVLEGIHNLTMCGGGSYENITFKDISQYLLFKNGPGLPPFAFHQRPRFINITPCTTCGFSPETRIEYDGELGMSLFDGWMTDYWGKITIDTDGTVIQSYGAQYGSPFLAGGGALDVLNGAYRMNGTADLLISHGLGGVSSRLNVWSGFEVGAGNLSVHDLTIHPGGTFMLGSGLLVSSYNGTIVNEGTFYAQNGIINATSFDSSAGTFLAGQSTIIMNGSGSLRTDGTSAGGFNDMIVKPGVAVTLRSDVHVNGDFINEGSVFFNGFKIYNNGTTYEDPYFPDNASASGPPIVDFHYVIIGNEVHFFDDSEDPENLIMDVIWTFGDGQTSVLENPTHIYDNSGTYNVTLTAFDAYGASYSKTIAVVIPKDPILQQKPSPTDSR